MSDIVEGEEDGMYTVTITGPMAEGSWTWTGYADHSMGALGAAGNARNELFEWKPMSTPSFVRLGRSGEDSSAAHHDPEDSPQDQERDDSGVHAPVPAAGLSTQERHDSADGQHDQHAEGEG